LGGARLSSRPEPSKRSVCGRTGYEPQNNLLPEKARDGHDDELPPIRLILLRHATPTGWHKTPRRGPHPAMTPEPQSQQRLRVLCLEDSPAEAEEIRQTLVSAGYLLDMEVAPDRHRFEESLAGEPFDVILADYRLHGFDAHAALEVARAASPLTPFVCVSATVGEEVAVELLKGGAVDLVLKNRLARLPFAVERAIKEKTLEREEEATKRLSQSAVDWRRAVDAMTDAIAVLGPDGRIMRCNDAVATLTGLRPEDIIGRRCHEVFHGTQVREPCCPRQLALASGKVETGIVEQDGRWLRFTFAPALDATGGAGGGVHVVTDVSDLKAAELRLLESVGRQQAVIEGVIAALARSVEVRDPYTAGHERRVGELAAAIAQYSGLDEETVRGVETAGKLHDVGKIVIPAEILTKPGRLSAVEFELIKAHAQAAYEILSSIEFDFPVADVVLQHHERLDGSGYPAGLSGETILPEAQILAVADVVEAMISHRPYRAALPLDAAMDELEKGAGRLYDAAICAATIAVCRESGFTLKA
jgi:PAS domain S-box-containing protein